MNRITFDDGLLNTYEVAFPIMEKYGVKGTVFVVVGVLEGSISSEAFRKDKALTMNWDQVKELQKAGWEIGSHSMLHRQFNQLWFADAKWELTESRSILADKLRIPCYSFAFPWGYGHFNLVQFVEAQKHYRYVRTMRYDLLGCTTGVPIEGFPPIKEIGPTEAYVIHLVKDLDTFEEWIENEANREHD